MSLGLLLCVCLLTLGVQGQLDVLRWKNQTWKQKQGLDNPYLNLWATSAAVLSGDKMTLSISPPTKGQIPPQWNCGSVSAQQILGFGVYSFLISSEVDNLDPSVIVLVSIGDVTRPQIAMNLARNVSQSGPLTQHYLNGVFYVGEDAHSFAIADPNATMWSFNWTQSDGVSFSVYAMDKITTKNATHYTIAKKLLSWQSPLHQRLENTSLVSLSAYLKNHVPPTDQKLVKVDFANFSFVNGTSKY